MKISNILSGTCIVSGIGMGEAFVLNEQKVDINDKKHNIPSSKAFKKFNDAINITVTQFKNLINKINNKSNAEIIETYINIAKDVEIENQVKSMITGKTVNLVKIVDDVFNNYYTIFNQCDDKYFKERANDILEVKERIINNLLGISSNSLFENEKGIILCCKQILSSQIVLLNKENIKGIIAESGGKTSHAAIILTNLGIPTIFNVKNVTKKVKNKQIIAIDANKNIIDLTPNKNEWTKKIDNYYKDLKDIQRYVNKPTITKDNIKLKVEANIGNSDESIFAINNGCEGIGLFRTEFLYMDNTHWPTEEEQFLKYKQTLQTLKNKLVVIRTLDIGGDKNLSYYEFPKEMNPFLGNRAIRFCLSNKNIFQTQIRALLRASKYGKLAIMFPMICTIDEFKNAKLIVDKEIKNLQKLGHVIKKPQIGLMVETPAAAMLIDKFSQIADFVSIGTNDLVQYSFACDRLLESVSYLHQPNNPALLKILKLVIDNNNKNPNFWVGMCGEMASDPLSIPLLVGLGLENFSVSIKKIPYVRKLINNLSKKDCQKLVEKALNLSTVDEVNKLVKDFLK